MDDILQELGWGDGFRIPVANDENRALEMEIQKRQKEKENLKSTLENIIDRVAAMKKHLENVQHQLNQNQNLIFAHNNQKAAEENLTKLARTEDNSLTNELKKVKKEQKEIQDRLTGAQMDIDRTLQHIDKLNATIKWDKDALLAWDEEVSRVEEDRQILEKFKREDEVKFKELELKRQCLVVEVENKRNRLLNLKNDVSSLEQSLDKTAQMFRAQHVDRRALVQQWEGSVRVLHQRDEDINRTVEEIGNLKVLARTRSRDLEEQRTFLENEEKNNKELEREIEVFNKQIFELREKVKLLESVLVEENGELATMKTILATTTTEFHKEIIRNKNCVKELDKRNKQLEEIKNKKEIAKEELEKCKSKTITAEERVEQLETMLKEEEKLEAKLLLEFKKYDGLMYQIKKDIDELKEEEKTQTNGIKHIESGTAALRREISKAKEDLNRQNDILYHMDFLYMEKDILYNKLLMPEKDENFEKYEKRIMELEDINAELTATNNLLTKELDLLRADIRRKTLEYQEDLKEENLLRDKMQENRFKIECGQKQTQNLRNQNQNKQVDENLLKLRIKQAENAIDKIGGNLFSMEKQRLELEKAMKEREIEIKSLRDELNIRRRILLEQSSNFNNRIKLAKLKVEHLKNKYDVEVLKLGKDENGEPFSITFVKIKGAQEKYELQELGDKLDVKIKKTEKEIEAMENTLKVVSASNKAFKNNLQSVDPNSPEQMEKEKLEFNQAQLLAEYRKKKAILESLQVITLDLEEEYQEKLRMEEALIRVWKEKDLQAAETDKELRDQEEKLVRAGKQLKKLIKEIRGTKIQKFQTIEEKDIELRELMDQNEYGLQQLAELVAKTYDIGPVVMRYLSEKGLSLPLIKSPAPSLRCPSTASLTSARSTVSSKSSKSSDSTISRSSSCVFTPSVVTLDSTRLSDKSDSSVSSGKKSLRKQSQSVLKKKGSK